MSGRHESPDRARVWGVGALVQAVGDTLSARFATCVVRGELSGFTRAASGHGYFTLKDEHGQASLRCAMFRRALSQVEFSPADGMLVEIRGQLAVYEARGELQMVVEGMRGAGAGALYEQFLRLKARLEAQGLFDAQRKRVLPRFPRRVAVVTSPAAAALRDVLTALARRAPHVEVVLVPCAVQGVEAPAQIVQALASLTLAHRGGTPFDAAILCRGGGSLEDLWAFNDERVVRAVVGCPVPLVCGVGHETDVTLSDLAVDLRAPTPTAAAELVAQDRQGALDALDACERHLLHRLHQRLDAQAQRVDQAALRLARPTQGLATQSRQLVMLSHRLGQSAAARTQGEQRTLEVLSARLQRAVRSQWPQQQHRVERLAGRLHALDPQRVLERGYAWLSDAQGQPLSSVQQVSVDAAVQGVLADGVLQLRVTGVPARRKPRAKP
ncbi:MAG: exodeoxyribonuclease VII large subunit [Burkholderiales bacterium]|nr:exodeoxyribonuclease VII large subunit [Burkholderiales bacterium]MBH2017151.1 exodeoxyribonuclease VII large subunit [Burkholderiales bacterium]